MKIEPIVNRLKCIHCGNSQLHIEHQRDVLTCNNCSHAYTVAKNVPVFLSAEKEPSGTKTEIHEKLNTTFKYIDHYEKDALTSDYFAERDEGTEHSDQRVKETIATQISGGKGAILDVGCGRAWVAEFFCPKGYEVVSMDISHRNTSKALRVHPFTNHYAVVADAYTLPFNKNSFEFIIASEIIEHVYDPGLFVTNLFSILKPGGKLIITTPYKEKIVYSLCIHCNNPTPVHAHLHSFDETFFSSLFIGDDLKNRSIQTFINKLPVHFRMHNVLKHLNFRTWNLLDRTISYIYNAPARIMVTWNKK